MEKKSTSFLSQLWVRFAPKPKSAKSESPPKFEFILKLDGKLKAEQRRHLT